MIFKPILITSLLITTFTPMLMAHADETQQVNGVMTTYAKPRYTTPVTVYAYSRSKMQVKNIDYLRASDKIAFKRTVKRQKFGYINRLHGYVSTNVMNRFKIPNAKRVYESTQMNVQNHIRSQY